MSDPDPLTLPEIRELTEFALKFAHENPTEETIRISKLIVKAAKQNVDMLSEFSEGYQVRGELHEVQERAAKTIGAKLQEVAFLPLCEKCRDLMNRALKT